MLLMIITKILKNKESTDNSIRSNNESSNHINKNNNKNDNNSKKRNIEKTNVVPLQATCIRWIGKLLINFDMQSDISLFY